MWFPFNQTSHQLHKKVSCLSDMEGNHSNGSVCSTEVSINTLSSFIIYGQLATALVILVVLCFCQRRRRLCHNCCWGYPGLPVPVDFLVTPRFRTIYTVIFCIMATSLIEVFNNFPTPKGSFYFKIVYKILIKPFIVMALLAVLYFPLFACVRAPRPLLGRILGLCYSLLWFSSFWARILIDYIPYICDPAHKPVPAVKVVTDIASNGPIVIGSLIVVIWYGYKTTVGVVKACKGVGSPCQTVEEEMTDSVVLINQREGQYRQLQRPTATAHGVKHYHLLHVRTLLRKPVVQFVQRNMFMKAAVIVKDYFVPYTRGFRFPLPFLGAVAAMSMLLYQFTITIVIGGIDLSSIAPAYFDSQLLPLLNNLSKVANGSDFIKEVIDVVRFTFKGVPVLICISPVVSFCLCLFLLVHMVGSVSKLSKQLAKEGFKVPLPSPGARVPSSWKYVGYQIGFFVLAYTIYTLLVMALGVVCAVLYLGFTYYPELTGQALLFLLVPIIWSQAIFISQTLICKFVFFQDKKTGKFIALKNRRLFNWFSFLLFFYNGIAGFVGAILRTLMASLFTLLLLFRLDRVVMMRGFERFDFGHKAFLGFMYLDYTYNSAVVHVFIGLLKQSLRDRMRASARSLLSDADDEERPKGCFCNNTQAHNRWLVAYTLIRNPSLQKLTASNLQVQPEAGEAVTVEMSSIPVSSGASVQRNDILVPIDDSGNNF